MQRIASDVRLLEIVPLHLVHVFVLGDVLVDAGLPLHRGAILSALEGEGITVGAHVASHAHIDHVGGMRRLAEQTGAPVLIGEGDREYARTGDPPYAPLFGSLRLGWAAQRLSRFDPFEVAGTLAEGDEVGPGFVVVETPGHAPGHISLWRERDRILVAADAMAGHNPVTLRPGLHEPPFFFSVDVKESRRSVRRLADLEPDTILFSHGPPMRDAARALRAYADRLPR